MSCVPTSPEPAGAPLLASCLCTQERLESPVFRQWAQQLGESSEMMHRKLWEWCYIAQALSERGLLRPGSRGLGFAVGQEPLVASFAARGCEITATDLDTSRARSAGWVKTGQHAANLEILNQQGLCAANDFRQRVSFQHADMNHIPPEFDGQFDFVWSSCSLEHLGSLSLGEQFVYNSLRCLKPGGVAVHTTEFNVGSNTKTIDYRSTVFFRRRDIERIAEKLTEAGHQIELVSFDVGDLPLDEIIDTAPYSHDPHLKVMIRNHVLTSVGLIIRKTGEEIPRAPKHVTPLTLRARCRPAWQWAKHRLRNLMS